MAWQRVEPVSGALAEKAAPIKGKARFRLDESVDPIVGEVLADHGYHVVYSQELRGHPDEDYLAASWRDSEILISHDKGFLDEQRHPPNRNPGIIVIEGAGGNEQQLIEALRTIIWLIGPYAKAYRGSSTYVSKGGEVTIRSYHSDVARRVSTRYRLVPGDGWQQWVDD